MSLETRNLTVAVDDPAAPDGRRTIVDGVDMKVADGERVGLIGPSGSGKSMIARALLGIAPGHIHVTGSAMLGDTDMAAASPRAQADVRGRYVGTVFQNPATALNPVARVERIVALPLELHYDLSKDDIHARVLKALASVGLPEDVARAYPHQLSGGQAQRVAIATALITSPRLIIADEPTTALDAVVQRQIVDLLTRLVDEAGASMLFITHDFAVLSRATTRCYVIDHGRIVDEGTTSDLLDHPTRETTRNLVTAARVLTIQRGQK